MSSNLSIENLSKIVSTGDVDRLLGASETVRPDKTGNVGADPGKTFSDVLRDSVEKVNQQQGEADKAIKELVAGRSKNIHETMLTIERADTSLKLMMQIRNKILDAYKEIMRMQV